ncbi:MAG: hypothetical protein KBC17_03100, partial [Candidatus Pacebacteria bacterium]|nr:hypothetical protein [Candidatus Paceibacterota bacterium]
QTSVDFNKLASADILKFQWALVDVGRQFLSCTDGTAYEDMDSLDVEARSVEYEMKTEEFNPDCINRVTLARDGKMKPFRYRIQPDGDLGQNQYLYFIGFYPKRFEPAQFEPQIFDCTTIESDSRCNYSQNCFWANNACLSKYDRTICPNLSIQADCSKSLSCSWNQSIGRCITALEQNLANDRSAPNADSPWKLPPCAYEGTCRNVNDVLQVAVTYAKGLFGIIGTAGLLFFIYGGFTIVMSGGSSDKVGKGKEIITAAVIGITICFSAYIAVDFLLDALQVGPEFREIGTLENQK